MDRAACGAVALLTACLIRVLASCTLVPCLQPASVLILLPQAHAASGPVSSLSGGDDELLDDDEVDDFEAGDEGAEDGDNDLQYGGLAGDDAYDDFGEPALSGGGVGDDDM